MPLDDDDIRLLTWQARRIRPHGARRWDEPGIATALQKVRHLDLAEVMMAVARAARDRDLDTPAAIGNPAAPCWIERPVERFVPVKSTPADRCGISGLLRDECEKRPRYGADDARRDDHTCTPDFRDNKRPPEAAADIKAHLRAEVRPLGDRPTRTDAEETA